MKVFLAVANFDKLYVNYTITKENGETESNTIVSDTNIIDLPYYENATYTLEYWAENRYQKTQKYTWGFTTIAQIQEPPPNIQATPTAGNTAVYVSWDNTAKGYTVHVLRRVGDDYTYETYATEHNYFVYTTKLPIEYVQFAVSCGIGPNKFISTYTNELKVSAIPTKPEDVQSLNITVPSVSYTTEYIHTSKSIRLNLTVTHSQGDVVLGTFLVLTDNAGKQWILTVYKGTTNETSSNAVFEIPWVYSNSQTFTLKAYPITTIGTIEEKAATVSIPLSKYPVTPPTPSLGNLISGGFDTVYVPWGAVSHPAPIVYELQYDTNSSFTAPTTITTTNAGYTVQFNFTSDTTVYFRIRAVDNWGNASSYSTVTSAVVKSYSSWNNALTQQLNGLNNAVNNVEYYARQITFVLNNRFEDAQGNPSAAGWNTWSGYWSVVNVSDGIAGKYAAQNTANTDAWVYSNKIPIDVNKQYIVECYARTISGTSGVFYLAVVLFDANGNFIAGDGEWWYYPAAGIVPPTTWTYYNGLFGANTNRPFPSNAKYMAVGFGLNYTEYHDGNRIMQVQSPYIREVFDGVYIRNGAIKDAHIESLNGDKIMAKTITADHLNINSLSAISANAGTITAGTLKSRPDEQTGISHVVLDLNSKQFAIKDSDGDLVLAGGVSAVPNGQGGYDDGLYIGGNAKLDASSGKIENLTTTTFNTKKINVNDSNDFKVTKLTLENNYISGTNVIIKAGSGEYKFEQNQLTMPTSAIDGSVIKDNSLSGSKLNLFSISASSFVSPPSFSATVSNPTVSDNSSRSVYSYCTQDSGLLYVTSKMWKIYTYSPSPSTSTTYGSGVLTVNVSNPSPSFTRTVTAGTEVTTSYLMSSSGPIPCSFVSMYDNPGSATLFQDKTFDLDEWIVDYTLTVTIGGFSSSTTYQIKPLNGAEIFYNGQWRNTTTIVSGITSIQARKRITSPSDTIRLQLWQTTAKSFAFNIAPIPGAKFLSTSTSITLSSFHTSYNPWNAQGYSDTTGTSGTSGWRWLPNLPLVSDYYASGQPCTMAWAWDFEAAFGRGVDLDIAIHGIDNMFYIFAYNGSSWSTVFGIDTYDTNFNIRTASVTGCCRLIVSLRDTGGEGFAYFTIGIKQ